MQCVLENLELKVLLGKVIKTLKFQVQMICISSVSFFIFGAPPMLPFIGIWDLTERRSGLPLCFSVCSSSLKLGARFYLSSFYCVIFLLTFDFSLYFLRLWFCSFVVFNFDRQVRGLLHATHNAQTWSKWWKSFGLFLLSYGYFCYLSALQQDCCMFKLTLSYDRRSLCEPGGYCDRWFLGEQSHWKISLCLVRKCIRVPYHFVFFHR